MSEPTANVTGATRKNTWAAAAQRLDKSAESNATAAVGTRTKTSMSRQAFIVPFDGHPSLQPLG